MVECFAILPVKEPDEHTSTGPQHPSKLPKSLWHIGRLGVDQRVPHKDASEVVGGKRQSMEIFALEFRLRAGGSSMADELFRQVNTSDISVTPT